MAKQSKNFYVLGQNGALGELIRCTDSGAAEVEYSNMHRTAAALGERDLIASLANNQPTKPQARERRKLNYDARCWECRRLEDTCIDCLQGRRPPERRAPTNPPARTATPTIGELLDVATWAESPEARAGAKMQIVRDSVELKRQHDNLVATARSVIDMYGDAPMPRQVQELAAALNAATGEKG